MVFSSIAFLCIFFPVVFLLHLVIPNIHFQNAVLILASVLFYAYGEPVYVILLLLSVAMNYGFGLAIAKNKTNLLLGAAVVLNLSLLVVFKYTGFLCESVNALLPETLALPVPKITLPIGISFYTFQALSYVIDVYREQVPAQKSFFKLLLYVSFFPQLIAGPIVKYHDIEAEIDSRKVTVESVKSGLFRFSAGLGKKVLIANTMAYLADTLFAMENAEWGLLSAWVGAIAYFLQIYFDFSGYSDMAIGLGRLFGFHFQENFNYPYISGSIQEFWRRWHISLSTWFKDYLYIPLGGNRKGKKRTVLNKYLVFLATGIWHGANWTFLVWGLYHGTLQMLEQWNVIPVKKGRKIFNHIYTVLAVLLGFVIFRADTVTQGLVVVKAMFGFGAAGGTGYLTARALLSPYAVFLFVVAVLAATPFWKLLCDKLSGTEKGAAVLDYVKAFGCLAVLCLTLMSLASNSYNPFIYFRF